MPFLHPLASDLLLQEEIRRQKRRLREKQDADRALAKRIEKSQRKQGRFNPFSKPRAAEEGQRAAGAGAGGAGEEPRGEGMKLSSSGKDEHWTIDGDTGAGANGLNSPNQGQVQGQGQGQGQGAAVAHRSKKRNRMQELGALCGRAISKKKSMVADAFQSFTKKLNLPSKDEIRDGCDLPVAHSLDSFKRDRGSDGESELEKKLREAVEREKRESKVEGKDEVQATSSKGPFRLFKNVSNADISSCHTVTCVYLLSMPSLTRLLALCDTSLKSGVLTMRHSYSSAVRPISPLSPLNSDAPSNASSNAGAESVQ